MKWLYQCEGDLSDCLRFFRAQPYLMRRLSNARNDPMFTLRSGAGRLAGARLQLFRQDKDC
ncbi:hypothetical protein Pla22_12230 [Rubripirellula amarantea]|uniref:Uncharacterized protein n=1 Tax=Rubripirellula amarantea TaxID=2527999 RepID=A0A5C5WUD6_9BACT|nr:hypothetical protein Pla22_12230 [Rubripirellula amarantea]